MKNKLITAGIVVDGRYRHQRARLETQLCDEAKANFFMKSGRESENVSEAVYCAFHEIVPPVCICGSSISYVNFYDGYRHHCSSRCAALDPLTQSKIRKTNIDRRGVDNPFKSAEIVAKQKETMQKKYGASNPMQVSEIYDKARKTSLARYGTDHHLKSAVVQEKRRKTNIAIYGAEHAMQSREPLKKARETNIANRGVEYPMMDPAVVKKGRETNLARYGVENSMQRPEIKDKSVETWRKKYGADHPSQSQCVRDKTKTTNLARYGVETTSQANYSDNTRKILFDKNRFIEFLADKSINAAAKILKIDPSTVGDYCRKYGVDVPSSSYEREIAAFLSELGLSYVMRSRSIIPPLELDFFIPEFRIAVEFNGLYWHAHERLGDKNYHLNKLIRCSKNEISLISINEDEWIERSAAVKNKIRNLCNKSERGLPGRKLVVRAIENKEGNAFVERYHIQGASSGVTASFGAFDGETLVSVMQFSKQRGTGNIELVRFCSDNKTHAGVFSKLFKHSVESEGYDHVISFADRRYSAGRVYETNGFIKTAIIPVDYRYVKGLKTFHKSSFTKKRISEKFSVDMSSLTERQAMLSLGYTRVYDCGKIRYEWRRS